MLWALGAGKGRFKEKFALYQQLTEEEALERSNAADFQSLALVRRRLLLPATGLHRFQIPSTACDFQYHGGC